MNTNHVSNKSKIYIFLDHVRLVGNTTSLVEKSLCQTSVNFIQTLELIQMLCKFL